MREINHAIAEMTVTNEHLNGGNVCQGGALFTLADLAIGAGTLVRWYAGSNCVLYC